MNIAIVHSGPRFGGIENQVLLLVNYLRGENSVVYITDYPQSQLSMELRNNDVKVYTISGNLITRLFRIKHICKHEKIDIVQAHTFDEGVKLRLLKLILPKIRIYIRVHTYIACSWISNFKKRAYYYIDSVTSPLVSKFIINGKYLLDEYKANTWIDLNKLVPIIDGIEGCTDPSEIFLSNIRNDGLKCLMIANVIPHKGHDVLIDAIKILKNKGIKIKCSVLGSTERDASYYNYIKEKAVDAHVEENVEFLGFSRDIWSVIKEHHAVILPSDSEGTPNCIMEAMSARRLVVVSCTGGTPEIVEDGTTGFLHSPRSAENLADVLENIISTPPEKLGKIIDNGYHKWKESLSISVMAEKFIKAYR